MSKGSYIKIFLVSVAFAFFLAGASLAATVFFDNFQDGVLSGWDVFSSGGAVVEEIGGKLHIKTDYQSYDLGYVEVSPNMNLDKDYNVSFRWMNPLGGGGVQGGGHWYKILSNGYVDLVWDNGFAESFAIHFRDISCFYGGTSHLVKNSIERGRWYDIEARVHHATDDYDVYVDGVWTATCDNRLLNPGAFRLGDDDSTNPVNWGEAYWDDFLVEGPPFLNITVLSPLNTTYNTSSVTASLYDLISVNCLVSANGEPNLTLSESSDIWSRDITGLADGSNRFDFFCSDGVDGFDSESVWFFVDTIEPSFSINSPENRTYNTSEIYFNLSSSADTEACSASSGGNSFGLSKSGLDWNGSASFSVGSHLIEFSCADGAGNSAVDWSLIAVDISAPKIIIKSPLNKTYLDDFADLNVSVSKESLCEYSLDGGSYIGIGSGLEFSTNLTSLSDAQHRVEVACSDGAGNSGFSSVTFTANKTRVERDIDGDGFLERAENLDAVSSNGFEAYLDNEGDSYLNVSIDGDGDGMTDFLINYTLDDRPDVYWDPDNDILSFVSYLEDGDWIFDSDGDGIPDKSYNNTNGSVGSYDAPPVVVIVSPQPGTYTFNSVLLEYWVSERDGVCSYSLNGGERILLENCTNTSIGGLANGNYLLDLFVSDSIGQNASSSTTFTIAVPSLPGPTNTGNSGGGGGGTFTLSKDDIELESLGRISFFNPSENISVDPNGEGVLTLRIQNSGVIYLSNVTLRVDGIPKEWYSVSPNGFNLSRGAYKSLSINFDVPDGEYGERNLSILVLSDEGVTAKMLSSLSLGGAPSDVETVPITTTTTTTPSSSPISGLIAFVSANGGTLVGLVVVGGILASIGYSAHKDAQRAKKKAAAQKSVRNSDAARSEEKKSSLNSGAKSSENGSEKNA